MPAQPVVPASVPNDGDDDDVSVTVLAPTTRHQYNEEKLVVREVDAVALHAVASRRRAETAQSGSCWRHFSHVPVLRQWYEWERGRCVLVRDYRKIKASWQELYFDLVFVALFTGLSKELQGAEPTQKTVLQFVVKYGMTFMLWHHTTVYVNRYGQIKDFFHRLFFFALTITVLGVVTFAEHGVVYSYLVSRLLTTFLEWRGAWYNARIRAAVMVETLLFVASALPWCLSLLVDETVFETAQTPIGWERLHLWGAGLLIDIGGSLAIPLLCICCSRRIVFPVNLNHFSERLGLFTLLVLGEQIIALIFDAKSASDETYAAGALMLALVSSTFFIYYECIHATQQVHAFYRGRLFWGQVFQWLHLPLTGAIIAASTGGHILMASTYSTANTHAITRAERWLFTMSQACVLLSLCLLDLCHVGRNDVYIKKSYRLILRLLAAVFVLVLGIAAEDISGLSFILAVSLVFIFLSCVEWFGNKTPTDGDEDAEDEVAARDAAEATADEKQKLFAVPSTIS